MRLTLSVSMVLALGAIFMGAASGASRSDLPMKVGDAFAVKGSKILCFVATSDRMPAVGCFLFRSRHAREGLAGSDGFTIADLGIVVIEASKSKNDYSVRFAFPGRGVVAPADPIKGARFAELGVGDRLSVAKTDLGCVVYKDGSGPVLLCKRNLTVALEAKYKPAVVTLSDKWIRVGDRAKLLASEPSLFERREP